MYQLIDLESWKRKEHFDFFSALDNAFWGIVTIIDCAIAYDLCKQHKISFFSYYLYRSLQAVNEIEEMKYRLGDDEVRIYNKINASSTIGRNDGTFGFSFIEYEENYVDFKSNLDKEIEAVNQSTGLRFNDNAKRLDSIHYSSIPWTHFTGLSHARNFNDTDSVPKITFGKMYEENGQRLMSISIEVHHGLADAFHVSKYLERFQQLMNELNL